MGAYFLFKVVVVGVLCCGSSWAKANPSPILDFLDPFLTSDDVQRKEFGVSKEAGVSGAASGHVGANFGDKKLFDIGGSVAGAKSFEVEKFKQKGPEFVPPPPPPPRYPPPPHPRRPPPPRVQPEPCIHQQGPQPQYVHNGPQPQGHFGKKYYRNLGEQKEASYEDIVPVDVDKDDDVDSDDEHYFVENQKKQQNNYYQKARSIYEQGEEIESAEHDSTYHNDNDSNDIKQRQLNPSPRSHTPYHQEEKVKASEHDSTYYRRKEDSNHVKQQQQKNDQKYRSLRSHTPYHQEEKVKASKHGSKYYYDSSDSNDIHRQHQQNNYQQYRSLRSHTPYHQDDKAKVSQQDNNSAYYNASDSNTLDKRQVPVLVVEHVQFIPLYNATALNNTDVEHQGLPPRVSRGSPYNNKQEGSSHYNNPINRPVSPKLAGVSKLYRNHTINSDSRNSNFNKKY